MNPVSPLFEKIDSSIEKKIDLIKSSYLRYAVRAMMACLFDPRNSYCFCDRWKVNQWFTG